MANQNGRHSHMMAQCEHRVTSQPHDANVKGDIFRPTIYPPSLVRERGCPPSPPTPPPAVKEQKKPGLNRVKIDVLGFSVGMLCTLYRPVLFPGVTMQDFGVAWDHSEGRI